MSLLYPNEIERSSLNSTDLNLSRIGTQLFFNRADLAQQLQRLQRFGFIENVERKSNVHNSILTHLRLGHIGQADFFRHTAEVHLAHLQTVGRNRCR